MDAGCSINAKARARLIEYLDIASTAHQGILSMQMHHQERVWTNAKTLMHFGVSPDSSIASSGQLIATILLIKRNSRSREIVQEWLRTLEVDPFLFTDRYSDIESFEHFKEHRHDQSVFSVIRKQHMPTIIPDETWFLDFQSDEALRVPFWSTRLRDSKRMYRKYLLRQIL
jgi:hypothetical protein